MVAVDVGANVGDTAAIIRCACKAPIVCIDGDRAMEEVLVHNAATLGGVRTLTTYLSDRREERLVGIEKAGWNATLVPPNGATTTASVPFTRLDDALTPNERESTKLLKIDTEGHEAKVLWGAERVLHDARPVVLLEYNREALMRGGVSDDMEVFSILREHGYQDALVWDCRGRFLLQTSLADTVVMGDLSAYIAHDGGPLGYIPYLDVGLFHGSDHALALECAAAERAARDTPAQ
jgi:FkbM family methyltransferase